MTAARIELYLKPSGDELDRAEALRERSSLREQNRKTTGTRLTYTTRRRDATSSPARRSMIIDAVRARDERPHVDLPKATDTIVVDGNGAVRTQTKSGAANVPADDGHAPHARPHQVLRRPHGRARRQPRRRVGRGRRPARPERRRQDDDVLHDRRPDGARLGPGRARRRTTSPTTRCTSGRARASATCRRSRRSSAA